MVTQEVDFCFWHKKSIWCFSLLLIYIVSASLWGFLRQSQLSSISKFFLWKRAALLISDQIINSLSSCSFHFFFSFWRNGKVGKSLILVLFSFVTVFFFKIMAFFLDKMICAHLKHRSNYIEKYKEETIHPKFYNPEVTRVTFGKHFPRYVSVCIHREKEKVSQI